MIVVDTGSVDCTKDIAKAFGAKVFDYRWNGDFSKARNFSLSKASGRWILVMDADEVISLNTPTDLRTLTETTNETLSAYSIQTRNYTYHSNVVGWKANKGEYSEEKGMGWFPSTKVRLFPNDNRIRFENAVHELVEPSLLRLKIPILRCPVAVHHFGKLQELKTHKKTENYSEIGRKKLKNNRHNAAALKEHAIQCAHLGNHRKALTLWKEFVKLQPKSAEAFVNMGTACWNLGLYAEAISFADQALRLNHAMKEALYNKGIASLMLGRADEATTILKGLLEEEPEYPAAQFILCVSCACSADSQRMEDELAKIRATPLGPYLSESFHDVAKRLFSASQIEYARRVLEAAASFNYGSEEMMALLEDCRVAA
jgi:tetratricopeptide (TPR) repeat protein